MWPLSISINVQHKFDQAYFDSTGSHPGQCNFESGICGYIQDKNGDKADWLRVRGHTPTSYTGPRGDHTTGVGESFFSPCFTHLDTDHTPTCMNKRHIPLFILFFIYDVLFLFAQSVLLFSDCNPLCTIALTYFTYSSGTLDTFGSYLMSPNTVEKKISLTYKKIYYLFLNVPCFKNKHCGVRSAKSCLLTGSK